MAKNYEQEAKKDSDRICEKVHRSDIPMFDKLKILHAMDFIHTVPCHLASWKSSKLYVECLADATRNLINVIGQIEEDTK